MLLSIKNDKFLSIFRTVKSIYMYVFLFALLFMRSIVPVSTRIPGVVDTMVFSFLAFARLSNSLQPIFLRPKTCFG